MSESSSSISRRRLLAGAGAGAAAVWAAPAVTTLGGAAFAAGSCVKGAPAFTFRMPNATPAIGTALGVGTVFSDGSDALTVSQGNVDVVGPGTEWIAGYTPVVTMDLTGTGAVTVTTLTGPVLPAGAYIVELDVYGAITGGQPGNNQAVVNVGASAVVDTGFPANGTSTLSSFSGTSANGGQLTLVHTSPQDNQGLFLRRLEVFSATCQ